MAPPPDPKSSPDSFQDWLERVFRPPEWAVDEFQRRVVLLLNHALQQEPSAPPRLAHQAGRLIEVRWRTFVLRLRPTPAGLLELAAPGAQPDLTLTLTEESPLELVRSALTADTPSVRIEGDVQLAAAVQWLVDHVRWDLEEDLSSLIGDGPAHALAEAARRALTALRQFAGRRHDAPPPGGGQPPAGPGQSVA